MKKIAIMVSSAAWTAFLMWCAFDPGLHWQTYCLAFGIVSGIVLTTSFLIDIRRDERE